MPDAGNVGSGIHAIGCSISLLSLCVIVEENKVDGEMKNTLGMSRGLSKPSFTITGLHCTGASPIKVCNYSSWTLLQLYCSVFIVIKLQQLLLSALLVSWWIAHNKKNSFPNRRKIFMGQRANFIMDTPV